MIEKLEDTKNYLKENYLTAPLTHTIAWRAHSGCDKEHGDNLSFLNSDGYRFLIGSLKAASEAKSNSYFFAPSYLCVRLILNYQLSPPAP